jgi:hypothetical protein
MAGFVHTASVTGLMSKRTETEAERNSWKSIEGNQLVNPFNV